MKAEQILFNARIILPNQVIDGSLVLFDGCIHAIDSDRRHFKSGVDCQGDYLMPGLIELHTDNLEKYITPRPGIYWPSTAAAVMAHDNQVFNAGITTVFDAVALGFSDENEIRSRIMDASIIAVKKATKRNLLKADHYLHLRCELPSATVSETFNTYADDPLLKLVSIMDHTPGQRQWRNLSKWRLYHRDKKWSDADAQAVIEKRQSLRETFGNVNKAKIITICREKSIPVASHDDTTPQHSREAWECGIALSEFPTTLEAAQTAKDLGMGIIMGAPNMVRGCSHSGNVSALDLASQHLLDGFSSDYMPISLLHSAFVMHWKTGVDLSSSVATITANISEMVHLPDRGKIVTGRIADLIRVAIVGDLPVVKSVWKNGKQILDSVLN